MRRRAAAADEEDLDITPMIDVTFLLLIFFMVSSTMQGKPDMPLPQAVTEADVDMRQATVITLLAEDGNPVILFGDDLSAPQGMQESVAQYVSDGVAQQKTTVVIKADKDLPSGFVEDISRAANVEGVGEMYFGIDKPRE